MMRAASGATIRTHAAWSWTGAMTATIGVVIPMALHDVGRAIGPGHGETAKPLQ